MIIIPIIRMRNNKKNFLLKKFRLKSIGEKVGVAAVFTDITKRGPLPKKASIYMTEMTAGNLQKRRREMFNIYSLSELYTIHWIQQRKLLDI